MSNWIRWEEQCRSAAEHLGWTIVDSDGVSDYQGWGALLLRRVGDDLSQKDVYGVLHWSYGSCSGCDQYEDHVAYDASPARCAEVFGELIQRVDGDLDIARLAFGAAKGW